MHIARGLTVGALALTASLGVASARTRGYSSPTTMWQSRAGQLAWALERNV